jgi:hypothetical protein
LLREVELVRPRLFELRDEDLELLDRLTERDGVPVDERVYDERLGVLLERDGVREVDRDGVRLDERDEPKLRDEEPEDREIPPLREGLDDFDTDFLPLLPRNWASSSGAANISTSSANPINERLLE